MADNETKESPAAVAEPSEELEEEDDEEDVEEEIRFRMVRPTDIPRCVEIEKASYPPNEAASKSDLQYRQHHAASYFRCAVTGGTDEEHQKVIGFICATRCHSFEAETMSTHHSDGPVLAVHSVVVTEEHRMKGVATSMLKDYVQAMRDRANDGVQKLVMIAKKNLLHFYVKCGFMVVRPSPIVHGDDQWYELQLDLSAHKATGIPYCVVDSFANVDEPGSGNPAAVVSVADNFDPHDPKTRQWMHIVAQEFNLSETAFVWPYNNNDNVVEDEDEMQSIATRRQREVHYNIRYFTPKIEVDLCGHATLAAAGILYRTINVKNAPETSIVFHAREDLLSAELPAGGMRTVKKRKTTKIAMKFPAKPAKVIIHAIAVDAVHKLLWEALKVPSDVVLFMGLSETGDIFVELTPEAFESIGFGDQIQYQAMLEWEGYTRGVIVSCLAPASMTQTSDDANGGAISTSNSVSSGAGVPAASSDALDFYSRFFGPKVGIPEDPATGSAHCSLGPYYCEKLGKDRVIGKQTSERGGVLECVTNNEDNSVTIIGTAVQTMTGSLWL